MLASIIRLCPKLWDWGIPVSREAADIGPTRLIGRSIEKLWAHCPNGKYREVAEEIGAVIGN
jgi:hypothetical protein